MRDVFHIGVQGAENFWTLPEYGEILFWGDKTLEVKNSPKKINKPVFKYFQDYEKELESVHGIPPAEIYKYPKCREFKQVSIFYGNKVECLMMMIMIGIIDNDALFQIPTDAGICHTFNGRPLDQLLRSSSWFTAFK